MASSPRANAEARYFIPVVPSMLPAPLRRRPLNGYFLAALGPSNRTDRLFASLSNFSGTSQIWLLIRQIADLPSLHSKYRREKRKPPEPASLAAGTVTWNEVFGSAFLLTANHGVFASGSVSTK